MGKTGVITSSSDSESVDGKSISDESILSSQSSEDESVSERSDENGGFHSFPSNSIFLKF